MRINVTKKLADTLRIKPSIPESEINPLFTWTANWTNLWEDEKDDMLVLVNNATRFIVAIHPLTRAELKAVPELILAAIRQTLLLFDLNSEMVDEYFALAGKFEFAPNQDRTAASWVSRAGLDSAIFIGEALSNQEPVPYDLGLRKVNYHLVKAPKNSDEDYYYPYQKMTQALTVLTGKQAYNYRAFELLVTLDLDLYQATRCLIVPADLEFYRLHNLLQNVFSWKKCHLYDFTIGVGQGVSAQVRLVPFEEALEFDEQAILLAGRRLDEFFPEHKEMLYTYDMGDNWEHQIEFVRVIENHEQQSPYLLSASGQAPPEDVGGVPGFIRFLEIYNNPKHPEHEMFKEWVGFWQPELSEWEKKPRVIEE